MPISRRKPFKYKENKVVKPPKTSRTEMTEVERAFAVGAITGMRGDYASIRGLATTMGRSNPALIKLLQRVEAKAEELGTKLWDQTLYSTNPGRGRTTLLSQLNDGSIPAFRDLQNSKLLKKHFCVRSHPARSASWWTCLLTRSRARFGGL